MALLNKNSNLSNDAHGISLWRWSNSIHSTVYLADLLCCTGVRECKREHLGKRSGRKHTEGGE